jgi:formyl-CoA transferase
MSVTGPVDGEPTKVGVALVDVICGLYTAVGVLGALAERQRSRRGQHVQVSLLDAALASLVNQASGYLVAGVVPERLGNRHPSIAPYETFRAEDRPIALAVGSDKLFRLLADALGRPALVDDPRYTTNADRVAHRSDLAAEVENALAGRDAASWVVDLRARGIPAGVVNDVAEAFAEAAALGTEPVVDTWRGDGACIPTVRSPLRLSATPVVVTNGPPTLGEHDGAVREWLMDGSR